MILARAPRAGEASRLPDRLPTLDGLRGVAILLVMFFHQAEFLNRAVTVNGGPALDLWYCRIVRSGWMGVDLFFVLSGFLITGILMDAKGRDAREPAANGRGARGAARSFRDFYIRRTLRIFPLYYAVLLVTLVLLPMIPRVVHLGDGALAHAIGEYAEVAPHQWWFWSYLANFYFAIHGWTGHGIPDVLWSLAIEEQFYLAWPWLVHWMPRRAVAWTCAALIGVALLFRWTLLSSGASETAVYVLTPGRLDALAAGGLVAALVRGPGGMRAIVGPAWIVLVATGALLLRILWVAGDRSDADPTVLRLGLTVIAIFFGALLSIAACARAGSGAARILLQPVLRMFGKYAYALYLFHVSVQSVVRILFMPTAGPGISSSVGWLAGSHLVRQLLFQLLATAATLALAVASWYLFERHFLKLKDRWAPK
ncbi:MAG: acyltransferase [Phycisphaerales bacterium]